LNFDVPNGSVQISIFQAKENDLSHRLFGGERC